MTLGEILARAEEAMLKADNDTVETAAWAVDYGLPLLNCVKLFRETITDLSTSDKDSHQKKINESLERAVKFFDVA